MKKLPDLVVPFKRPVYERVVREFAQVREAQATSARVPRANRAHPDARRDSGPACVMRFRIMARGR